ncbi:hypothetical protein GGS23DRAFT_544644 [Durotheca rogersii]|uniref:uncharacterized protein n=1 Tax=Durotheca rogersii TaxID=419775 RepID=UPI002220BA92|nr:uncharacterized protein GGS23DRAFT_544644 [Durotheca rogersii]KAI5868241.1 hypothetical protein GGS23DRAFT_544644 [Durotheca rogersii]
MLDGLLAKTILSIQNPPERTVCGRTTSRCKTPWLTIKDAITVVIDLYGLLRSCPGSSTEQLGKKNRVVYGDETQEDLAAGQETEPNDGLHNKRKNELY